MIPQTGWPHDWNEEYILKLSVFIPDALFCPWSVEAKCPYCVLSARSNPANLSQWLLDKTLSQILSIMENEFRCWAWTRFTLSHTWFYNVVLFLHYIGLLDAVRIVCWCLQERRVILSCLLAWTCPFHAPRRKTCSSNNYKQHMCSDLFVFLQTLAQTGAQALFLPTNRVSFGSQPKFLTQAKVSVTGTGCQAASLLLSRLNSCLGEWSTS